MATVVDPQRFGLHAVAGRIGGTATEPNWREILGPVWFEMYRMAEAEERIAAAAERIAAALEGQVRSSSAPSPSRTENESPSAMAATGAGEAPAA